ncbi:hypothetical protein E2C01_074252 [Portunus trituberculatus]|uniref:Uncharacterized protein n=1 Tax=Portunus trituberculatus TaxID=210409 RepID=A0A5B7I2X1_PORTR|nr:hypothetical protein [Portunus trituberculatus]
MQASQLHFLHFVSFTVSYRMFSFVCVTLLSVAVSGRGRADVPLPLFRVEW